MKNFLKLACATTVLLPFSQTEGKTKQSPNFIQILTDDQGYGDLACFGHPVIKSPHIDQLAKDGIKFSNCYAAHATSSPSRAAILTGRTPFRNGVYRWIPANHFCHLPASEITIAQQLRDHGYDTAHFGKWHLSQYKEQNIKGTKRYENFAFDFNKEQPSLKDYGYDYYFATGNVARPDHKNPENFFINGEALGKLEGYSAQIVANQFVKWLKERKDEDKPFFVTIWFHEPHGPVNSDPRFLAYYKRIKDPSLAQYFANISQIDDAVGVITKALKETGEYNETLIWYTSDNGPEGNGFGTFGQTDSPYDRSRFRGETGGLRGRKRNNYEGGIRVPGIICWPDGLKQYGTAAGNISGVPISGYDVMPTLLELAQIQKPSHIVLDGTSIVPLLQGKKLQREKPLYWRNEALIALRSGNWKIVGDSFRKTFELYNLDIDYRETTDVSSFYPEIFERLKKRLIEYDNEVLTEGRDWYKEDKKFTNRIPLIKLRTQ